MRPAETLPVALIVAVEAASLVALVASLASIFLL